MVTVETGAGQSGKSSDTYKSVITVETCSGQ